MSKLGDLFRHHLRPPQLRALRAPEWALLRIWHFEALETVIEHPRGTHFMRESYASMPQRWRELPEAELRARVEHLLIAHYRLHNYQLSRSGDPTRMMPFAYWFEWVDTADRSGEAAPEPWVLVEPGVHPALVERALGDLAKVFAGTRKGIASRCYTGAFAAFRIDDDDSWHIVRYHDRAALFAIRHPH